MVVTLAADGALVQEADDCATLHVATALDPAALRSALKLTGTGHAEDDGTVWLDVAVLRSRAQLAATAADWSHRWTEMVAHAERSGRISPDGRKVRATVSTG